MIAASAEDLKNLEISILMPVSCGIVSCTFFAVGISKGEMDILGMVLALIPGAILLFLAFATRQSIGYGDGLMAISLAPFLGLRQMCFCIVVAFTLSSILAVLIMLLKKGDRKARIPFIPLLAIGVGVTFVAQI